MNNLYLILHKVRGEPAFDIAQRCDDMGTDSDPGPWWIIPTSGHRAYPYWTVRLGTLDLFSGEPGFNPWDFTEMPEGLPDHYATRTERRFSLIEALGLNEPAVEPTFKRRI